MDGEMEVQPPEPPTNRAQHGLLPTPVTADADGRPTAWCRCGDERKADKLGDAHGAVLHHAAEKNRTSASGEVARPFTVATDRVPAVHTRIRLTEHGEVVGEIEVMHQAAGSHLVIGEQVWHKPVWLPVGTTSQRHFAAVSERLVEEAIALADRLGASLSTMTPGSVLPAERLQARGFHRAGDMWFRERPGSVVVGTVEASPAFGRHGQRWRSDVDS